MLEQITTDLVAAMRAHDERAIATLRLLKSALMNEKIAKQDTFGDADVLTVLTKEAKRRREAITMYEQGGRPESAAAEKEELVIIERYLPTQPSEGELAAAVTELIAAGTPSQKGALIGALRQRYSLFDGALASRIIDTILTA
jgi:hypothetical protein